MVTEDKRTVPWCTVCLVTGALICHVLVLLGNLQTSHTFSDIGDSTGGWSNVGLSLAMSMKKELDLAMSQTVSNLTDALQVVVDLSTGINDLLGISANSTDDAVSLLQNPKLHTHPVILTENNDTLHAIWYRTHNSGYLTKDVPEEPLKTVSLLSFGEIPDDGKLQIHQDIACLQTDEVVSDGRKVELLTWTRDSSLEVNVRTIRETLKMEVSRRTEYVVAKAKEFWQTIKPALLQVGAWLHSMGNKMMGVIEQFSMTIDKVQKIFDQIMKQVSGAPQKKEAVVYNTFSLFDLDNTGRITLSNIQETGSMYGITALIGKKGADLFKKYDEDESNSLTEKEYAAMLEDEDIPSAATYILRQYAKKLSQIGGNLAAAVKRDEVASTIVDYMTLMGVKNHTKISWVSERLTNGSLVKDVTANIFKTMAENTEDPVQTTTIDVPQMVVDELLHLNSAYTMECFELMSDPEWWVSQGFDSYKQPKYVKLMAEWIAKSPHKPSHISLLSIGSCESLYSQLAQKDIIKLNDVDHRFEIGDTANFAERMGQAAYGEVYKRTRRHQGKQLKAKIAQHKSIFAAKSSSQIFKSLLGTATLLSAGAAVPDADVVAALKSGVDALPETLEFAKFLSWNATQAASRFDGYAFDYAQTSSNVMESFANQVKGMVNAVSGFLNTMMEHSTPRGIKHLEDTVTDFVKHAAAEVTAKVDDVVGDKIQNITKTTTIQKKDVATDTFSTVAALMMELQSILPTVINDLKFARTQVSAVAQVLDTVFGNFALKGKPIFKNVARLYATLWKVYFVFFVLMSLILLFYGFWATGWLGGPTQVEDNGPPQPTSFKERCVRCCRACNWCMHNVHNNHLCFWSCMLLSETVILTLFIVGIILCVFAGAKAFLNIECAQIYLLGDDVVCTSMMSGLNKWLMTFWGEQGSSIDSACMDSTLTACKKIIELAMQTAMFTVVGSFAAAILSFQILLESASLHEKARWLHLAEMAK